MIYEVTLTAPAISEVVTTAADTEEEAIVQAVYSAVQRMLKAGTATAKVSVANFYPTTEDSVG